MPDSSDPLGFNPARDEQNRLARIDAQKEHRAKEIKPAVNGMLDRFKNDGAVSFTHEDNKEGQARVDIFDTFLKKVNLEGLKYDRIDIEMRADSSSPHAPLIDHGILLYDPAKVEVKKVTYGNDWNNEYNNLVNDKWKLIMTESPKKESVAFYVRKLGTDS